MSDDSSMDGSEWQYEGDTRSWNSEEDLSMLMNQFCRVCAETSEDMIQCFGERGKEIQLIDKIHTHLPIMVTEDDLLPINVCTSCITKLEVCHELVNNCLEADARLRTILGFDVVSNNEEQYEYVTPESPDSVVYDGKPKNLEIDNSIDSNIKQFNDVTEENEVKPELDTKSVFKPEAKDGYQVILLKMKKSKTMSTEMQIEKAVKFLKSGGNTYKVLSSSNQNTLILQNPEKKISDVGSPSKNSSIQNDESLNTAIPAEQEKCIKSDEQKDRGQTVENDTHLDWAKINYECIYCDENILGKNEFIIHQSSVHNNEVYSCEECVLVYEVKEDFDEHVRSHQKEKVSSVTSERKPSSTCQFLGNSKRKNMSKHSTKLTKKFKIIEKHSLNESFENEDEKYWTCKVWQCKFCRHVATTKQEWKDHVCEQPQEYQCPDCGDQFYTEQELEEHQETLHKEEILESRQHTNSHQANNTEEQRFQCAVCGKMYDSWMRLVQHSRIHFGDYKCPLCDRSFNRQSNLVAHMKRHKTEHGFTCRICLETFSNRGELLNHRRTHSRDELLGLKLPFLEKQTEEQEDGEEEEETMSATSSSSYKCPICYRTYQTQQRLEVHVAMHTDSSFPCHICGKVLSKKNTLEYHLRTHTGEKPFTCRMCPGAFQSRVGLIVHERIHTGEKPYQCDKCEMAFRCRATLNQHKVVHSEERPYRCIHCGRGFRRRDTLDTHIRTHTDERPYACTVCGRAFRQKGDCSKHEKTHDKHTKSVVLLTEDESATVYNCPLCGQMYELKEDLDQHFENEHTPEEKASSIVIINSENVITIPGIATVGEHASSLVLHELS